VAVVSLWLPACATFTVDATSGARASGSSTGAVIHGPRAPLVATALAVPTSSACVRRSSTSRMLCGSSRTLAAIGKRRTGGRTRKALIHQVFSKSLE
jgi:hypothetical protein